MGMTMTSPHHHNHQLDHLDQWHHHDNLFLLMGKVEPNPFPRLELSIRRECHCEVASLTIVSMLLILSVVRSDIDDIKE